MENVVNLLKLSGGFLGRYAIGLLVAMKTEMVNMGMRLEDGVRTGRLTKEVGSSGGTKKYGSGFLKKKEHDATSREIWKEERRPWGEIIIMLSYEHTKKLNKFI
jgi:hypothetical protein